jgi:hypothetical protein
MSPETIGKMNQMQQANLKRAEERYMYGSGRKQLGEAPDLNTFNGLDMSPEMGVPGGRLAREAYLDIYAHNYNGAIPILQNRGLATGGRVYTKHKENWYLDPRLNLTAYDTTVADFSYARWNARKRRGSDRGFGYVKVKATRSL